MSGLHRPASLARRTLFALCLLGGSTLALADSGGNDRYRPGQPQTRSGAGIYQVICQGCHMPDGKGAIGAGKYPALAGDVALASSDFVVVTLIMGRRNMPAFGGGFDFGDGFFVLARLDDEQIAAVGNYVRTNFGNRFKGNITAAQVKALRESLLKQ